MLNYVVYMQFNVSPGSVTFLGVNEQVLYSQQLIIGDHKVLLWHIPTLAVFCPQTLAINVLRV